MYIDRKLVRCMEIYLDNSATTKPYKEVIDKMVYALSTDYANPSSLHRKGVEVEKNIKNITFFGKNIKYVYIL